MKLFLRSAFIIVLLLLADVIFYACYKPKRYLYNYTSAQFKLYENYHSGTDTLKYIDTEGEETSIEKLEINVELRSEVIAQNKPFPGLFVNSVHAFQYFDN